MSNSVLAEMRASPEFINSWGVVWRKLHPFLLEEQRKFALENRGKHEQIGQYVEFMARLSESLSTLDDVVMAAKNVAPQRPKLHNREFTKLSHAEKGTK